MFVKQVFQDLRIVCLGSQPTDVSTPSGSLQQNIQFIFSEYDNQLRREKSIAGMRDKLLRGEWCVKPPMGYDSITKNGKRSIVVNKDGEMIRKAFLWFYYGKITQMEIFYRLKTMGLKISRNHLSSILRNPFYCGILSNKLLGGKVVKGKQEKIISPELFLEVNEILKSARSRQRVIIKHSAIIHNIAECFTTKYLNRKNIITLLFMQAIKINNGRFFVSFHNNFRHRGMTNNLVTPI